MGNVRDRDVNPRDGRVRSPSERPCREGMVCVADDSEHGSYRCEFVEYPLRAHIAGVHDQVDAAEDSGNSSRQDAVSVGEHADGRRRSPGMDHG